MTDELLEEQIRYYRARAPEYDETSPGDPFAEITARVSEALRGLGPVERAIELGAGTGQFTADLAPIARHLVAIDSSPETLAINAAKVTARNVTRIVADVFDWRPSEPADLVAFRALHSHVPSDRLAAFWDGCRRHAHRRRDRVPRRRVGSRPVGRGGCAARRSQRLPLRAADREVVIRTLTDGRRFRIVKVLWDPPELAARLAGLGWQATFTREDPFFWGTVRRASAR